MSDSSIKNLPTAPSIENTMSFVVEKSDNTNENIPFNLLSGRYKGISIANANQILNLVVRKYYGFDSVIETFLDAEGNIDISDIDGSSTGEFDNDVIIYKTDPLEKLITSTYDFIINSHFEIIIESRTTPSLSAIIDGTPYPLSVEFLGNLIDQSVTLPSNQLLHYPMTESTATSATVNDIGIAGNDMSVTGATLINAIYDRKGYECDGIDDVLTSTFSNITVPFTISFWFCFDDASDNIGLGTVYRGGGWTAISDTPSGNTVSVDFRLNPDDTFSSWAAVEVVDDVEYGKFEHWAFSADLSGNLRGYHNGELKAASVISPSRFPPGPNDDVFQVGSLVDYYEVGDPRYYFSGKYTNIQLFPSVLTDDEIRILAGELINPQLLNAYTASSIIEGSQIQLQIEDSEELKKYSIYAEN